MANFYRVKDGNWNLADSWADASGGTNYYGAPPTSSDDVFFDANTPTGTHTVNVTASTLSLDFTGFGGTLAGSSSLYIYGSLTLGAGMTNSFAGLTRMRASSGTVTITSNGKNINRLQLYESATFQLVDKLTLSYSRNAVDANSSLHIATGTLDANGQEVEFTGQYSSIDGAATFYTLTKSNGGTLIFSEDVTIANSLSVNGASATDRVLI